MEGYVYLIKSEASGYCKIGVSKNPNKRIKQLQTGNSDKIYLVDKYKSEIYKKIENVFHTTYSHLKVNGEWFDLTLEQELNFINEAKFIEDRILVVKLNNNE